MKDYERYLNEFYSETYSNDDLEEEFIYVCNPSRPVHTILRKLREAIRNGHAGYMLRKYDPIAFNVGYREYILKP